MVEVLFGLSAECLRIVHFTIVRRTGCKASCETALDVLLRRRYFSEAGVCSHLRKGVAVKVNLKTDVLKVRTTKSGARIVCAWVEGIGFDASGEYAEFFLQDDQASPKPGPYFGEFSAGVYEQRLTLRLEKLSQVPASVGKVVG